MNTITQTVSSDVATILPQAFIDYLWGLVEQDGAFNHAFLLSAAQLNGRPVQNILHLTDDGDRRERHKVYGFRPVDAAISVTNSDGNLHMALSGPIEAIGLLG